MTDKLLSIAIDGPAGAGKTTVAKRLGEKLNILYLNTGAMYRAAGLHALRMGLDPLNEEEVLSFLHSLEINVKFVDGAQRTYLNGEDITKELYKEEAGDAASKISSLQSVRDKMVFLQRKFAKTQSLIIDGRDITTVVLKETNNKFYLDATPEERAKRRLNEYETKGDNRFTYEEILEDIITRDKRDMTREHSPLMVADDAIHIDSTNMTINEVVEEIHKNLKR